MDIGGFDIRIDNLDPAVQPGVLNAVLVNIERAWPHNVFERAWPHNVFEGANGKLPLNYLKRTHGELLIYESPEASKSWDEDGLTDEFEDSLAHVIWSPDGITLVLGVQDGRLHEALKPFLATLGIFPDGSYSPVCDLHPVLHSLYREMKGRLYKTTQGACYVLTESGWSRVWPTLRNMNREVALVMYYRAPPDYAIREDGSQDLGPCLVVQPWDSMVQRAREILFLATKTSVWDIIQA